MHPCNTLQSHVTWDKGSVADGAAEHDAEKQQWGHEEGGFTLDMELCKQMITQVDREALTATRQTSADVTNKILPLTHPSAAALQIIKDTNYSLQLPTSRYFPLVATQYRADR